MSWTDENEPTINNEPTSYEELELAFAKLQKKYEENNELLRLNNRKLDRLEENHEQHVERGTDHQQELSL